MQALSLAAVARRSALYRTIPIRSAAAVPPPKPGKEGKPAKPAPANPSAATSPKPGAATPTPNSSTTSTPNSPIKENIIRPEGKITRREAIQKVKKFFNFDGLINIKKDWGEVDAAIRSDEYPDWLWQYEAAIPSAKEAKAGFALKYNPNNPEELRIYTKRLRRNRIKAQNAEMKETKGIPQKK